MEAVEEVEEAKLIVFAMEVVLVQLTSCLVQHKTVTVGMSVMDSLHDYLQNIVVNVMWIVLVQVFAVVLSKMRMMIKTIWVEFTLAAMA